jgi:hypothetical protein
MDRIKEYLSRVFDWFRTRSPRMTLPNVLATGFVAVVALIAPHQTPVLAYKLGAVSAGGCLGYLLDVSLFPYAQPSGYLRFDWRAVNDFADDKPDYGVVDGYMTAFYVACARRTAIVCACMLAVALAL